MSEFKYLELLSNVLYGNSIKKEIYGNKDRYLLSQLGHTLKFDLTEGFPVFTTRQTAWKNAFREMLWFIKGEGDVVDLHKSGCKWWDEWGLKYYNEDSKNSLTLNEYYKLIENGDLNFCEIPLHYTNITKYLYFHFKKYEWCYLDQTKWVIDEFNKNPDRKSYLVNYWEPERVYQMADQTNNESVVLPACHFYHQLLLGNNGELCLIVGIRSSDLFFGLPANVAQYALLLSMYSHCLDRKPGQLIVQLGDHHIYSNVIPQVEELLLRTPLSLPQLKIKDRGQKYFQDFTFEDFELAGYQHLGVLGGELTVVGGYDKN